MSTKAHMRAPRISRRRRHIDDLALSSQSSLQFPLHTSTQQGGHQAAQQQSVMGNQALQQLLNQPGQSSLQHLQGRVGNQVMQRWIAPPGSKDPAQ